MHPFLKAACVLETPFSIDPGIGRIVVSFGTGYSRGSGTLLVSRGWLCVGILVAPANGG